MDRGEGKGTRVVIWDLTIQTSFDGPKHFPIGLPCPIPPPYTRPITAQPTQPVRRYRNHRGSSLQATSGRISGIVPVQELDRTQGARCSSAWRGYHDDRFEIRTARAGSR